MVDLAVKPLAWKAVNEGFGHGRMHYGIGAFGHWYGIKREKAGHWSCVHHVGGTPVHLPLNPTFHGAKLAAQADYDERILASISSVEEQAKIEISHAAMELFTDLRAFFQMMTGKADTPLEKQFADNIRKQFAELAAPSPQPREVG